MYVPSYFLQDELKPMLDMYNPVEFVGETLKLLKADSAAGSRDGWSEKPFEGDF
jgi:hypothetical protein